MVPHIPAKSVGYRCRVILVRSCSVLTSRQVKYVQETFKLTNAKSMLDFVFRLYNFVSLANEDNHTLRDPAPTVGKLHQDISKMNLPALTTRIHKMKDDDNADNGSSKKPRNEGRGGHTDNDILSNVAILEALKGAGYTIPPEVEGFESLLPVRVSFP
jgi:hypothetical protein